MRLKYPNLARLAIDMMTVPASSCECERLFSELGDLLEPRRRKIGSQLLAAIQCVRSWRDAGFKPPFESAITTDQAAAATLTDDEMVAIYDICEWDSDTQ